MAMICSLTSTPLPRILAQEEAIEQCNEATSAVISFIDPGMESPVFELPPPARHLIFRFHDVIRPLGRCTTVTEDDTRALIAFCRAIPPESCGEVIIHCQQGISRSTAAAMILLETHGKLDDVSVGERLFDIRPIFWPNSAMLNQADALLDANGRLASTGVQLRRMAYFKCPEFVSALRDTHRRSEVDEVEALLGQGESR